MRALFIISILFFGINAYSQHVLESVIKDSKSGQPLPGATATIKALEIGGSANAYGLVRLEGIPSGQWRIDFSFLGYESQTISLKFPTDVSEPYEVLLEPDEHELEEVVISSTRSSRTIADIPTRVEFIAGEELDEKANMKPGDIRMLLNESTGIQTQQTSATSANASIRIQGLDGRYTQLLKDGFPLYAGFSGGLGLLQILPLDLKQVEVIKGSSSTLYGGGAIAGLVNLISKVPEEERELKFLLNATSAGGLDVSGFYGKDFGKVGITLFGSRNSSEPYDPADIGLTAIPKVERYTFNPKVFIDVSEKTSLNAGFNFTAEDRVGGDIEFIQGNGDAANSYFEDNASTRYSSQLSLTHKMNEDVSINIKNSINHFDRTIEIPGYRFDGVQNSTFTEFNYVSDKEQMEWVAGANLWTDAFAEKQTSNVPVRNYTQTTFGAFVQNSSVISDKISLELGLRGDYVIDYGFALLPRFSLLFKTSPSFSTRIGGGFGYKAPTIFTEDSERVQYQNILPISPEKNKLEKSYGANWDVNYRREIGEVAFSINQLFFYTYLTDPLMLTRLGIGSYEFINLDGFIDTKGTETNVKIEYADFKLFLGYTFTDAKIHEGGETLQNPLTARHRLNNVLMYEVEEKWRIGLEAYYFSKQKLTDNTFGEDYWICGLMIEKMWEPFSLFLNFENFLDSRQTRFDTIYTGSISNPVFRDIYAPLDGFVINGGVKLNL